MPINLLWISQISGSSSDENGMTITQNGPGSGLPWLVGLSSTNQHIEIIIFPYLI